MIKGKPGWIGKTVRIHFHPDWPINSAVFVYEGYDDDGHWVRNAKYGHQRRYLNRDIDRIEVLVGE